MAVIWKARAGCRWRRVSVCVRKGALQGCFEWDVSSLKGCFRGRNRKGGSGKGKGRRGRVTGRSCRPSQILAANKVQDTP